MEVIELTLLSPCVSVREYRGSTRRARGLKDGGVKNSSNNKIKYQTLPCRVPQHCGVSHIESEQKRKGGNTSHPPPLCFAQQNIGEVSARTEGLIKTAALLGSFFSLLRRMNK